MEVKTISKNLIYKTLNKFSPMINWFSGSCTSVLMYHSIGYNDVFFTVRPEEFKWQMSYVKENKFNVLWIDEIANYVKENISLPKKTIALTFDDGYQDFYDHAFPVLEKCRFKATVFLPTHYIGHEMVNSTKSSLPLLNWEQIREIYKNGFIQFGPHGVKHVHLTELDSANVSFEINESRRLIKENLGEVSNIFCYPRGKYNSDVIKNVSLSNFNGAVTVDRGIIDPKDNVFSLKRNSIDSSTSRDQFVGKLSYSVEIFEKLAKKYENNFYHWRRSFRHHHSL